MFKKMFVGALLGVLLVCSAIWLRSNIPDGNYILLLRSIFDQSLRSDVALAVEGNQQFIFSSLAFVFMLITVGGVFVSLSGHIAQNYGQDPEGINSIMGVIGCILGVLGYAVLLGFSTVTSLPLCAIGFGISLAGMITGGFIGTSIVQGGAKEDFVTAIGVPCAILVVTGLACIGSLIIQIV